MPDTYLSVLRMILFSYSFIVPRSNTSLMSGALQHASLHANVALKIEWVESSQLEKQAEIERPDAHRDAWSKIRAAHGVLVPGGFGDRGVEG